MSAEFWSSLVGFGPSIANSGTRIGQCAKNVDRILAKIRRPPECLSGRRSDDQARNKTRLNLQAPKAFQEKPGPLLFEGLWLRNGRAPACSPARESRQNRASRRGALPPISGPGRGGGRLAMGYRRSVVPPKPPSPGCPGFEWASKVCPHADLHRQAQGRLFCLLRHKLVHLRGACVSRWPTSQFTS